MVAHWLSLSPHSKKGSIPGSQVQSPDPEFSPQTGGVSFLCGVLAQVSYPTTTCCSSKCKLCQIWQYGRRSLWTEYFWSTLKSLDISRFYTVYIEPDYCSEQRKADDSQMLDETKTLMLSGFTWPLNAHPAFCHWVVTHHLCFNETFLKLFLYVFSRFHNSR